MKKKKILYTIPNFETAGSGKVVECLTKGLKEQFEIEIACFKQKGKLIDELREQGIKFHTFQYTVSGKPYYNLLSRLQPIIKFFKENQFDLIHSWHYLDDWSEPLAAKLAGIPFVYTKKSMSWDKRHWWFRSKLSSRVITINRDMDAFFPNWKKKVYIPLGLDTEEYKPMEYDRSVLDGLAISDDKFVLCSTANLVPVKGIEVALRAISECNDKQLVYVLVGGAEEAYLDFLKKLIKELGIESQIYFVGKKADVRPYLQATDLYLIPTLNEGRKEGLPMAPVEAMSCERVVCGSNIPGVSDILSDFPEFLFESGDYKSLANIINSAKKTSKEERKEIAEKMRQKVVEEYNLDQFLNAHVDLYEEVI